MVAKAEWRWATIASVILVMASTLPYLIAYLTTPADLFYTGFLSNPVDGNTYLAKMQQGLRGEWLCRLAYTAEPHQGEFLFTYYVLLGHVARWTRLPLIVVFHLARVINGFALLLVLYYVAAHFVDEVLERRFAFVIASLGSGLGWLLALGEGMTVDLWVPEGYVFYSLYVNPHFPLAMAVMVLTLLWSVTPWGKAGVDWQRLIALALCAAILGVVQPFCLLTVGAVLLVYAIVRWGRSHRPPWREIASGAVIGAAGLPLAINDYLVSARNPAFASWSEQNQTLSPPPWDYAAGYGVVLLLALVGLWKAARQRRDKDVLLTLWVVCTAVLLYAPLRLQRRLAMGLIVPLGMLATMGWYALPRRCRRQRWLVWAGASLTHIFLIGVSLVGALTRHEALFVTGDERAALDWLAAQAAPDALVIAAPQTGLYIPAWTGRRVFYGHRFETANAQVRQRQLIAFFESGERSLLRERPDYLFYGPRERVLSGEEWQPDPSWKLAFRQGDVSVYAISTRQP